MGKRNATAQTPAALNRSCDRKTANSRQIIAVIWQKCNHGDLNKYIMIRGPHLSNKFLCGGNKSKAIVWKIPLFSALLCKLQRWPRREGLSWITPSLLFMTGRWELDIVVAEPRDSGARRWETPGRETCCGARCQQGVRPEGRRAPLALSLLRVSTSSAHRLCFCL